MKSETYKLLEDVHTSVNTFPYASDEQAHGTPEFWEPISKAGTGDCEDYVLEKRKRLIDAGVPHQDLRIGVVNLPSGTSHAVLVVRDGETDWVSDQTRPYLMTADQMKGLGYTADKLQVPGEWNWETWKL